MKISKVTPIFFSPTGTSKKVASAIAQGFDGAEIGEAVNLTYDIPDQPINQQPGDLAILAAPVYAGRVAAQAVERMKQINGNNSMAVVVVLYGNREFEDALLELSEIATSLSFNVIGAGAFVGEHSFSSAEMPIAHGRPDDHDLAEAKSFGRQLSQKIQKLDSDNPGTPEIPGNTPYKEGLNPFPVTPQVDDSACTGCGVCLTTCPTGAISLQDDIATMAVEPCIFCCACVKNCPESAVKITAPPILEKVAMLNKNCAARKEPQIFL